MPGKVVCELLLPGPPQQTRRVEANALQLCLQYTDIGVRTRSYFKVTINYVKA